MKKAPPGGQPHFTADSGDMPRAEAGGA